MKNKRHKFLKRGEGLKRFQRGNNAFIPTKEKEKNKKSALQNQQPNKKKNVVLNIEPPLHNRAPKAAPVKKTRPGLPLKLKLQHRVQKETAETVANTVPRLQQLQKVADTGAKATDDLDPKFISPTTK